MFVTAKETTVCKLYSVRVFKNISLDTAVRVGGDSEGLLRLRRVRCVDRTWFVRLKRSR